MDKLRLSWKCCAYSLGKLKAKPILLALLLVMFLYMEELLRPVRNFLSDYGLSVNVLGMFAFLLSDTSFALAAGIGLILLFGDAPFFDDAQRSVFIRTGQTAWIYGQILYIFAATALYLLALFLLQCLALLPYAGFGTGWGRALNTLALTEKAAKYLVTVPFPVLILDQFGPVSGFFTAFALRWLVFVICAMAMFWANIAFRSKFGSLVTFIILLMDPMIQGFFEFKYYIYSITSLARLNVLNFGYNPYYPKFPLEMTVLGLSLFAIMALIIAFGKRRDIADVADAND